MNLSLPRFRGKSRKLAPLSTSSFKIFVQLNLQGIFFCLKGERLYMSSKVLIRIFQCTPSSWSTIPLYQNAPLNYTRLTDTMEQMVCIQLMSKRIPKVWSLFQATWVTFILKFWPILHGFYSEILTYAVKHTRKL